jgi:phosphosulfolactate phosphohydrolase-like enzyme
MSQSDDPDDKVGYGRPPRATRFQKGRSGNPNGRPKGSKNLASIFAKAARETVIVTSNGRRHQKSKLEVIAAQQTNKAAGGDLAAAKFIASIVGADEHRGEAAAARQPVSKETRDAGDKALLADLRKSLLNLKPGDDDGEEG